MHDSVVSISNNNPPRFGLTDSAANRILVLLKEEKNGDDKFMRVSVEGGGCSGFQYVFSFDTVKDKGDLMFTNSGATLVVDEISLDLIQGGKLDYVEELIGSYFQVVNPNAISSCGCGTSFSI